MLYRTDVIAAVSAAVRRVYPDYSELKIAEEVIWNAAEMRIHLNRHGRIIWKEFPLGRMLFERLGEAQNWRCCYCGVRMLEHGNWGTQPSLEHFEPLSLEGADHPDNMAVACMFCNQLRGLAIWWNKWHRR